MSDPCVVRRVRVYDADGVTLRGDLDATGVTWRDDLGGGGSASMGVPLLQDLIAAEGISVLDQAVVKYATNLGADPEVLTDVYAWVPVPTGGTLIDDREKAGRTLSYRGVSLRDAFLSDYLVASDGYPGPRPQAEGRGRYFGFMRIGYLADAGNGWVGPNLLDTTEVGGELPDELVDLAPDFTLIAVDLPSTSPVPEGADFLARGTFTTTAPVTSARVYMNADDYLEAWLDGEQIFTTRKVGLELDRMKAFDVDLLPGTHVLAARVTNGRFGPPNYMSLYALVVELDDQGIPASIITRTGLDGWLVHTNTPTQAETAAAIKLQLRLEAAARGITPALRLVPSFTASTSTEGVAWPDRQERAFPVGAEALQVALELDADGVSDDDVTPDLAWHSYVNRGADRRATIRLEQGVNIVRLAVKARPIVGTRAWVQSGEGWSTVTASAAELTGVEPREFVHDVGSAPTSAQARKAVTAQLPDLARIVRTYTATIEAVTGVVPRLNFDLGDIVILAADGVGEIPVQIVSLGVPGEDEVKVLWSVELKEVD